MNYDLEHWKPIKDYENLYEMSDLGSVKSLVDNHGNRRVEPKILKTEKTKRGYLTVGLWKDGKQKHHLVHRLVAETFIPNPLNLPQVNHINEDKTDNRACNLEWVSAKYNVNYGTGIERMLQNRSGIRAPKKILQYALDGELVKEWSSTQEAGRNGFNQGHISACCSGKRKTHKGFIWRCKKEVA